MKKSVLLNRLKELRGKRAPVARYFVRDGGFEPKVFIFDIGRETGLSKLEDFLERVELFEVADSLADQVRELFQTHHPSLKSGTPDFEEGLKRFLSEEFLVSDESDLWQAGRWVYFPWRGSLVHFLPEELHFELRTNRNRNSLTFEEQQRYAAFTVGLVGLSVGGSIALTLALTGGSLKMKLADPDVLSVSNLNRIRAGVAEVGLNKCYLSGRQILELNPYAQLSFEPRGLNEKNIEAFFTRDPKPCLIVDEIDDLEMKLAIREAARKFSVPVIMATDCGEGVLLDVERYDTDPTTQPFHGRLATDDLKKIAAGELKGKERLSTVTKIVGLENVSARKTESLLEIGKTLYTWPQLGSSVTLCGAVSAFAVQRIALGQTLKKSQLLSLEESFLPDPKLVRCERTRAAANFFKALS